MSKNGLTSLVIQNLRGCVRPFTLRFEQGKKFSIIYGENGSGKSTICDAFDFIGRGNIGSLDGRGLGTAAHSYWATIGKAKNDVVVELKAADGNCRASAPKSAVVWVPATPRPRVEILRRSQLLKLIESASGKRYEEVSRFINVSGVETSEAALKTLLDEVNREQNSKIERVSGNLNSLEALCGASGGDPKHAILWARQEAGKDFSSHENESKALVLIDTALQRLSPQVGAWANAQQKLKTSQDLAKTAEEALSSLLTGVSKDAGEMIDILLAARPFLSRTPEPTECPLCQGSQAVEKLGERVDERIKSFRSLTQAKESLEAARKALVLASNEPPRLQESFTKVRSQFQAAIEQNLWSQEVPLPNQSCPENLSDFDGWYEINKDLGPKWRALLSKRVQEKNTSEKIREVLKSYDDNHALPQELEPLIAHVKQALALVQEERRSFTDGILGKIAAEVGRLYEIVHPGEGLQKIGLHLDPKQRASLDLAAEFCGKTGVPPQAYFSESHLDTLGLCIFLALAKMEDPSGTILVIDDIFASVDEPHVERLIDMIHQETADFRHCIITTHYRPWKEKYRWGWLNNGSCQFIELGKWTELSGLDKKPNVPELEDLASLLREDSPDLQSICGKAGVILEATLDFLTQLYQCRLPRRSNGKYTLVELLLTITRELRSALRVEVLGKDQGMEGEYTSHHLGEILDELEGIMQARSVLAGHGNEHLFERLQTDAHRFSTKVLELSKLLVDEERGWPRDGNSGSYWATSGETRRLHPLEVPN